MAGHSGTQKSICGYSAVRDRALYEPAALRGWKPEGNAITIYNIDQCYHVYSLACTDRLADCYLGVTFNAVVVVR